MNFISLAGTGHRRKLGFKQTKPESCNKNEMDRNGSGSETLLHILDIKSRHRLIMTDANITYHIIFSYYSAY